MSEGEKKDLTNAPLRARFALEYAKNGGNATQAALAAGYSENSAAQQGSAVLKDDRVQAAIRRHQNALAAVAGESRDTVLAREINWAQANIKDYFITATDTVAVLKPLEQLTDDQARCIKKLSWNQHGPVLELHDQGRANRNLAEYLGLTQKEGNDLTPEDAASLIAAAMDAMEEVDGAASKADRPRPSTD
jgi:phage terminase small subunit